MSAVCVLTPLMIAAWPAIAAAVTGAAAAMGFSAAQAGPRMEEEVPERSAETEIENSEILAEGMTRGESMILRKGDLTIAVGCDERGRCTVCVTGQGKSDRELRKIGEEVAGRVVQQFTYNKLLSELKKRNYQVADEQVLADQSIKLRIRL